MPFLPGPGRLYLPHHALPSWLADLLTFEEAERHLHCLQRVGCGCMKYRGFNSRAKTRVQLANDITRETPVARLIATLSADRPLGPQDVACHRCDTPECAHPDHLRIGSPSSNQRDRAHPGRRIRVRTAARWYDYGPHWVKIHAEPPTAAFGPVRAACHVSLAQHIAKQVPRHSTAFESGMMSFPPVLAAPQPTEFRKTSRKASGTEGTSHVGQCERYGLHRRGLCRQLRVGAEGGRSRSGNLRPASGRGL